jgi:hypothetical protein
MAFSGAAFGRSLMINWVSRLGYRRIFLATLDDLKHYVPAAHMPLSSDTPT